MAEKPQEVAGINKVIAELKKLNKASAKDMLREREAQQHAEKIALGQEVQEEQGSSMISAGEAFQRRFLAGQAKTIADQKMQDEGSRYSTQQEIGSDTKKILEAVDKIYGIFEKKKGDEE